MSPLKSTDRTCCQSSKRWRCELEKDRLLSCPWQINIAASLSKCWRHRLKKKQIIGFAMQSIALSFRVNHINWTILDAAIRQTRGYIAQGLDAYLEYRESYKVRQYESVVLSAVHRVFLVVQKQLGLAKLCTSCGSFRAQHMPQ